VLRADSTSVCIAIVKIRRSRRGAKRASHAQQSTTFVRSSPNIRNLCGTWRVLTVSCHAERDVMSLSVRHKPSRLPKRFPVGTAFVVEGRAVAADGKNAEHLRVISRFVVLPGGRRIDLGGDSGAATVTRGRARAASTRRLMDPCGYNRTTTRWRAK